MSCGIAPEHWTVLEECLRRQVVVTARQVAQACEVPISTSQGWVQRLRKQGLLQRGTLPGATSYYYYLTELADAAQKLLEEASKGQVDERVAAVARSYAHHAQQIIDLLREHGPMSNRQIAALADKHRYTINHRTEWARKHTELLATTFDSGTARANLYYLPGQEPLLDQARANLEAAVRPNPWSYKGKKKKGRIQGAGLAGALDALAGKPRTVEALARISALEPAAVRQALARMALAGEAVCHDPDGAGRWWSAPEQEPEPIDPRHPRGPGLIQVVEHDTLYYRNTHTGQIYRTRAMAMDEARAELRLPGQTHALLEDE